MSFERAGLAILMMMLLRIRKYCRIILAAAAKALALRQPAIKSKQQRYWLRVCSVIPDQWRRRSTTGVPGTCYSLGSIFCNSLCFLYASFKNLYAIIWLRPLLLPSPSARSKLCSRRCCVSSFEMGPPLLRLQGRRRRSHR